MGIREHLGKQDPDNLKLHDISTDVEQAPKEPFFVVEKDLTKKDWKEIKKRIAGKISELRRQQKKDKFRNHRLDSETLGIMADLNILSRTEAKPFNQPAIWEEEKKELQEDHGMHHNWLKVLDQGTDLKLCFPNQFNKSIGISTEDIRYYLDQTRIILDMGIFKYVASLKIFVGEKFEMDQELEDRLWSEGMTKLDEYRQNGNQWTWFIQVAANLKILFPGKMKDYKFEPQDHFNMKAFLDKKRQEKKWSEFAATAAQLKIIAAPEIKITDRGIEFPPQKYHRVEKKQRPERKTF